MRNDMPPPPTWAVYILRCADGSLYTGIALDVEKRLAQHNAGKGAKYTRTHLPVEVECMVPDWSRSDALKLEHYIKTQPKSEKIKQLMGAFISDSWRQQGEKSGCCNRPVGKGVRG